MKKLLTLLTAVLLLAALPCLAELQDGEEEEDEFSLDELFSDAPESVQLQVVSTTVQDDGTVL